MQLENKVVVITGSGGGIGEACAHRFTAEGAKVVITDIDAAGVDRVSRALGTVGLATDITVEANVNRVIDLAHDTYGDIDLWFSNAGVNGPVMTGVVQDDFDWQFEWNLHVMSHVWAARALLPRWLERGHGYLLQTASVVAFAMQKDKGAYSVTKHAALALNEWLAATYRPRGIKVSCFCPGAMLTPMLLSNEFPADHPIMLGAATPEQVADRLVAGIEAERFLILDSDIALQSMAMKLDDYESWIRVMEGL